MSNRRRNVRVSHQEAVRFEADNGVVEGRSIDISRSGMQVVVNLSEGDTLGRSITFSLPTSDGPVRVPVRVTHQDVTGGSDSRVGVEFQFEAGEQMRLIDRYIREIRQREIEADSEAEESRRIPRCDCAIEEVRLEGVTSARITNISTEGVLLEYEGSLIPGEEVELSFSLPGESRSITATASVVYVVEEGFLDRSTAGVQFTTLKEVDRARIRNFVVGATSSSSVRSLHEAMESNPEFTVGDPQRVLTVLDEMRSFRTPVHLLIADERRLRTAQIVRTEEANQRLLLELEEPVEEPPISGTAVHASFHHHRGSYLFSTLLEAATHSSLTLALPQRLSRTEKRSYQRKQLEEPRSVRFEKGLVARLVDISWRGFLCKASLRPGESLPFAEGETVGYEVDEDLGLDRYGQVRRLRQMPGSDGTRELQIGIEAGVRRSSYSFRRIDPSSWAGEERFLEDKEARGISFASEPISITDSQGRRIEALMNSTGSRKAPVVLVPPAFGKKKETLAPLAATLIANAAAAGVDLIVLRFDGINRPGESHNDNPNPARGYEMLHYRPRQGIDDIARVVDFIYSNDRFEPDGVALFTSSMSSVDARKFLFRHGDRRVHAWVNLMGVPAARTTLTNILAGTDIIANAKMGIRNGMRGMLGHLVDMDLLARDLIEEKYAFLTDARLEMASLALPILWIYGAHDRWVDPEEVEDLMSIDGGSTRELIEIPTGHNLRGSRDAVEAFKLASEFLLRNLCRRSIEPLSPPRRETIEMVTRERERLENKEVPEMTSYWQEYLLGNERNSEGYDFYRNFREFREFMRFQIELLDIREGDVVADMGCGTGVVTETILHLAGSGLSAVPSRVVGVDLIPEALERAGRKCDEILTAYPSLSGCEVTFLPRNLEPDRLIPIREFLAENSGDIGSLTGRVEGLTRQSIEAITRIQDPGVRALLGGAPMTEPLRSELMRHLDEASMEALLDLNGAAAFVREGKPFTPRRLRLTPPREAEDLGIQPGTADRIIASLFISYLFNPRSLIAAFRGLLKPGGMVLVSSMRPDSDVSVIFTDYVSEIQSGSVEHAGGSRELEGAQAILSEAAALFELEEEGHFHFYSEEELALLLTEAGFQRVETYQALGTPPQAVVARGYAP